MLLWFNGCSRLKLLMMRRSVIELLLLRSLSWIIRLLLSLVETAVLLELILCWRLNLTMPHLGQPNQMVTAKLWRNGIGPQTLTTPQAGTMAAQVDHRVEHSPTAFTRPLRTKKKEIDY